MAHDTGRRAVGRDTAGSPPAPDPRRWPALTVLLVAGFMDMLDVTIVNVAAPTIMRQLPATYTQVGWMMSGYVLGFAALLITGGRLGDIFGRKLMFLIGTAGFTVASALCGFADTAGLLITGRFCQGAMAGLMVPQILAIIHVTFPPAERPRVLGLWGAVLGIASVVGLAAGGLVVQWDLFGLSWRPIFLLNIPVGLLVLTAAWRLVRESRSPSASRVDLVGAALAVAVVLMLVYPLAEGRNLGWPPWIFLLFVGGLVLLLLFVRYEWWRSRTVGSPLVVLDLFQGKVFAVGMVVWLVYWIALGGFFLVWTLYLQVGLGWEPLPAGLTAVFFALGAAVGSSLSVQLLVPRFGRRVLMAGTLLLILGFAAYSGVSVRYGPDIAPWQMVAPLFGTGIGFGLVVAPMVNLVLGGVPLSAAGSATGLLSTTQQVGMALGVALVGMLFFAQLDHGSGRGADQATPALQEQLATAGVSPARESDIAARFRQCVRDRSTATDPAEVPDSCQREQAELEAEEAVGAAALTKLLAAAHAQADAHNFARTFGTTLWYLAGVLTVFFVGLFALPRRTGPAAPPGTVSRSGGDVVVGQSHRRRAEVLRGERPAAPDQRVSEVE